MRRTILFPALVALGVQTDPLNDWPLFTTTYVWRYRDERRKLYLRTRPIPARVRR